MRVYHGSYTKIIKPEIKISKFTKDFGNGFYCTIIREQAERWASRNETKVLNTYNVNIAKMEKLTVKNFEEMTDEWLQFIVDSRNAKQHNYDIVIGAMANDQIYNFIDDYISGNITKEMFWALAKFKYPTHQIAFCTKEALDCLDFIESEVLQ